MGNSLHTSKSSVFSEMQNAKQNAFSENPNAPPDITIGTTAADQVELAALRLQDAVDYLETLLIDLPNGSRQQDDIHEAIGRIMETQFVVAAVHAQFARTA